MKKNKESKAKKKNDKSVEPSLVKEILSDLLVSHWYITFLILIATSSAMMLAKTSHDSRRAIAQSQSLREEQQQKLIELQSLRLELTSLTEADRISSLARKQLDMIDVRQKNEKIITL